MRLPTTANPALKAFIPSVWLRGVRQITTTTCGRTGNRSTFSLSLTATAVEAHRVAETAFRSNRKLVTSYMLRHHPSWVEFIRQPRQLGPPFMTMSPSRPSAGNGWYTHKRILRDWWATWSGVNCDNANEKITAMAVTRPVLIVTREHPALARALGLIDERMIG
ncbi:hypothetical protein N7534_011001 [Penicillium rubens]|nr:hypothetical protein N7534_011001 [Penicillium rubens]